MKKTNPVLNFDWETDIRTTPPPKFFDVTLPGVQQEIETSPSSEQLFPRKQVVPFVEADPNDVIILEKPVFGGRSIHVHKMMWMRTFDQYVYQYYRLMRQQENESVNMISVDIPNSVYKKYVGNQKTSQKRRKSLNVNEEFILPAMYGRYASIGKTRIKVPKFGCAVFLNRFCRDLCTRRNAVKQKCSLFYDGLKFRQRGTPDFIPKFALEDYIEHELLTGISLSIEITSVLLEFTNDDLRNKAWKAFSEELLPKLVLSPLFFTRNAVARNFFQQIMLESGQQEYEWNPIASGNVHLQWESTVRRAKAHAKVLIPSNDDFNEVFQREFAGARYSANWYEVPDDEIEASLSYIKKLLEKVICPINLPRYINNPTRRLALFCHPKHTNVKFFLEELEKEENRQEEFSKSNDLEEKNVKVHRNRKRDTRHVLFAVVHSEVKRTLSGSINNQ